MKSKKFQSLKSRNFSLRNRGKVFVKIYRSETEVRFFVKIYRSETEVRFSHTKSVKCTHRTQNDTAVYKRLLALKSVKCNISKRDRRTEHRTQTEGRTLPFIKGSSP